MLFDQTCPLCGRAGSAPCPSCIEQLEPVPLLGVPAGLDACRAITGYRGLGRELVRGLKFHNHRSLVPWLASCLAEKISRDAVDVITWAPTSSARRRERGFDQAEVLARRLGRVAHLPVGRCLVRLPGPAQTGRHRDERISGPGYDAGRRAVRLVQGRRVALVDDVATTGATVSRAAEVLRGCGATAVIGVVIARTPPGRDDPGPLGPRTRSPSVSRR